MSDLLQETPDSGGVDMSQIAQPPRVGFLDAFDHSVRNQVHGDSAYGLVQTMADQSNEQLRALRGAGEMSLPEVDGDNFVGNMDKVAGFYVDGGDPEQAQQLRAYDDHINELKTKYPKLNLRTTAEMYQDTTKIFQQENQQEQSDRHTLGGLAGDMAGGVVASLDAEVNPVRAIGAPLAFIAGPEGATAKAIAGRIGLQGGLQGLTTGVEQLTGTQRNKRLSGLPYGTGDALESVVGATIGGGVAQGAGELLAGGFRVAKRRWFTDLPDGTQPPPGAGPGAVSQEAAPGRVLTPDEAAYEKQLGDLIDGKIDYMDMIPPRNLYGDTTLGRARTLLDVDNVTQQLNDWSGGYPHEITPRTTTDIADTASSGTRFSPSNTAGQTVLEGITVDAAARRADPKTFQVYDALAAQVNDLRAKVAEARPDTAEAQSTASDLTHQIGDIEQQIRGLDVFDKPPTKVKNQINELKAQREQLVAQRDEALHHANGGDTPEMAAARQTIQRLDQQMRDLAPVVSRAYARVRGEWKLPPDYHGAISTMIRDAAPKIPDYVLPTGAKTEPTLSPKSLVDRAPILAQAPKVADKLGQHADAADVAHEIMQATQKVMDEALDKYRGSLSSLLKEDGEGKVQIVGTDLVLDLDKDRIAIPQEKGDGTVTVSVRDLLEDNLNAEQDLKAVTSCST